MLAIKIVAHTLSRTQINCIFFDVRLDIAYGCYSCRVDVLTQDLVCFVVYHLGIKVKGLLWNKGVSVGYQGFVAFCFVCKDVLLSGLFAFVFASFSPFLAWLLLSHLVIFIKKIIAYWPIVIILTEHSLSSCIGTCSSKSWYLYVLILALEGFSMHLGF